MTACVLCNLEIKPPDNSTYAAGEGPGHEACLRKKFGLPPMKEEKPAPKPDEDSWI